MRYTVALALVSIILVVIVQTARVPESGRVVGGSEAKPHSAPYIVSFRELGDHICGGSIINTFWILSAAHCFLDVINVEAVAGIHSINDEGQRRIVERYFTHEEYSGRVGPYDIAVVKVHLPFEYNQFVQPVSLPTPNAIPKGQVIVFGWGSISNSNELELPEVLHTATKPIVDYETCLSVLPEIDQWKLLVSNICTGPLSGGYSACIRDSGGPLVQKTLRGGFELVGIVSWGYYPCGMENSPSVYTRVSAYIEWMYQSMYNRSTHLNVKKYETI